MPADKLETALVLLLQAPEIGTVVAGQSSEDRDAAVFICDVSTGDEYPPNSGNYRIHVDVHCKLPADKDNDGTSHATNHAANVAAMKAVFNADDLEASLSGAVADFHVFKRSITGRSLTSGYEGRQFHDVFSFDCVACETNF